MHGRILTGWLGAAAIVLAASGAGAATVTVTSDITTDRTWTANNVYVLTKPIFVRDGATLTIEAGTVIRGEKEATTDPGALVISRGAKLRAMGTPDAPIVMTNMQDDNVGANAGSGNYALANNGICRTWGGLILLGRTYIATKIGEPGTPSPNAALERQIEGLEPFGTFSKYGGGDDDDDSGEVHYVSIRYGGFVLGDANEINGLTLGAVGRGTQIDHVEVFQNKDDAFEFFGGTVDTKHLIAWCVGDDSFDWDEGFRGKGQFWLSVQGPLSSEGDISDKGAEMDGGDGDSTQPSAIPTVYNATYVGTGKESGRIKNAPLHFRDGSGGRYYNSLFMDYGGACALIEGDPGDAKYDSADNTQRAYVQDALYRHEANGSRKLEIMDSIFWKFGFANAKGVAANSGQADDWGAEAGKDDNLAHYGLETGFDLFGAALRNVYLDEAANDAPVKDLFRSEAGVPIGSSTFFPVEFLDPTLADGSPYMASGRETPADPFFVPVAYAGAFGTRNWAGPWSLAYRLGTLHSDLLGDEPVQPRIVDEYMSYTIVFPTMAGAQYRIEFTPSLTNPNWQALDAVTGTGDVMIWTDQRELAGERYYRVVLVS